jgi:large subunit ribosomal protein L25
MATTPTHLDVKSRMPAGSRDVRRLRRAGFVPGVLYGGVGEPVSFAVEARALRHALHARGAVLDVAIDGAAPTPAVLKDQQRDAVRGQTVHIDLVRVRLDRAIQTAVPLVLVGAESAPGVRDGGVLEQITHELQIEALPTAVPESIEHDVSGLTMNHTVLLEAITAPSGVTLLGDPQETVIATLSPPRLRTDAELEIELETGVVGEDGEAASDSAADDSSAAGESGESSE